ncbi:hypothetical protein [Fibrella forsythiae]|uniref:Outer membrane protein beta-barrel domain-containing protein n=1 Tax=Fibrella forsythiae TaxID=2817061 RepID=A0ABS3JKB9_9BACT|nr:hypothetical protein [Fibrella forsythiae]MBO0950442.1 hypothetical protein [Fibrella forsythiae]
MTSTRTLLLVSLLLSQLLHLCCFGQAARRNDEIVRNDNTVIQGLISEINETAIFYRKSTAPQGQQYQVKKSDVRYIRYSNGEVERFDAKSAKPVPANRPTTARNVPITSQPAASNSAPRTRFGLTAGAGGGFWMAQSTTSDMGLAIRGGITAEVPLGKVALAPSVEFLQLTQGKSPATIGLSYAVGTLAIASLYNKEKPVNLFYSVGVFGAYGLNVSGGGESASFKDAGFSAFHAGGDVKLGARFSQELTVYAQGDYGFTSMAPATAGIPTVSQVTVGLGIRYLFGK